MNKCGYHRGRGCYMKNPRVPLHSCDGESKCRYQFEENNDTQLTLKSRLKLCFEVLTIRSGHAHPPQEKQLAIFQRGYAAGLKDAGLERKHDDT